MGYIYTNMDDINIKNKNNPLKKSFKSNRSLPENFFEKIIEYEMKLKYDFSMETLNNLIEISSSAIEFYEGNDDEKYKDYQNRLNILLSQPDILKNINKYNNNQNNKSSISNVERKMRKEREKKQIQLKINYISQINNLGENEKQVEQIMNDLEKPEVDSKKDNILCDDISKQKSDFKSRLEKKRRKTMVKSSAVKENLDNSNTNIQNLNFSE